MASDDAAEIETPHDADVQDESKPLPPLPDGGLSAAMPDWLRLPPAALQRSPAPQQGTPAAESAVLDPRTLLSADDLPAWIRRLADEQQPTVPEPAPLAAPPPPIAAGPPAFPRRRLPEPPAAAVGGHGDANAAPAYSRPAEDAHRPVEAPRSPTPIEHDVAWRSGPNLVWPVLIFVVGTVLLIVAFRYL